MRAFALVRGCEGAPGAPPFSSSIDGLSRALMPHLDINPRPAPYCGHIPPPIFGK
jgi:hypothetical protein